MQIHLTNYLESEAWDRRSRKHKGYIAPMRREQKKLSASNTGCRPCRECAEPVER